MGILVISRRPVRGGNHNRGRRKSLTQGGGGGTDINADLLEAASRISSIIAEPAAAIIENL